MKCPICNSHRKRWLGEESFECKDCGFFYANPVLGATLEHTEKSKYEESLRCPICNELTEGIGDNLEHLEDLHTYNDGYRNKSRWFHPGCWKDYQQNQANRDLVDQKQIRLLERVSQVPCPYCGSQHICLSSSEPFWGTHEHLYWECLNCEKRIDKHWLMLQIKRVKESTK